MRSRHGNLLQALASQSQPEECWPLFLFHVRDDVSYSNVPMGIEFSSAKGTNPNVPFAHRSQIRTHSSTSSTNTVLHVDLDIHSQQSRPTPLGNRSKHNPSSPPLPAPHQPTANATARQVKTA
ncbi:hypothetical protein CGLO_09957 [Colletotrichum gloeosporioides Cg-14]|uniref:Uncharacterized protein n=1 Tax=Colletotrichum gloeosporioides (strain Cg-14) TaxID=1237896 RepID=T0LG58_COLGC|nr:hypothetical protein CGLO_09957 [Colletotrichum gloeosporioides Cg-14]